MNPDNPPNDILHIPLYVPVDVKHDNVSFFYFLISAEFPAENHATLSYTLPKAFVNTPMSLKGIF